MYDRLDEVVLKTGEKMEIGVVRAPDDRWASLLLPLLNHKPLNYKWHLEKAFLPGGIENLETRFYIGLIDSRPISNIMTVEVNGIGILGHVYTVPEHRRKNACRLVMNEQMADFNRRGGRYLSLGTDYDTHPYWIYHRFGFRGVVPEYGLMTYEPDGAFLTHHFQQGAVSIAEPTWKDWPLINTLCTQKNLPFIRSMTYGLLGPSNFEGGYLTLLERLQDRSDSQARLLKSEHGAVVGFVALQPDARWHGDVLILDLFVHPTFAPSAHALLQSIALPTDRKIQCYAEEDATWKIAALLEEGFEHEATFRGQLKENECVIDVEVYERSA